MEGSGCLRRLPTQLQTAPFPALSGTHSQTCILVSVTGPQSHLAWAQALSSPPPRESSPIKGLSALLASLACGEQGGTMDFSVQQLVRM